MHPPIAGEQLHALVVAAADGAEAESRALLQATLPLLVEYVAAVLVDKDDGQTAADKLAMRNELLGEVAHRVIEQRFLAEWRRSPAKDAWRFLESRVQQFAVARRDRAWVLRALDGRSAAAKALLFARLRQLFDGAARHRKLGAEEREDAFQSFSVWLLADGGRSLLRWDPEGGRSFDGWFFARALNQIDTRRRNADAAAVDELVEDPPFHDASRLAAHMQLGEIDRWLKQNCSERQYDIFIRNFVEQQSATEIAAAMGVQPGVVYMTILRLRRALASFQMT
ncbi:RNA polymerase sigma factor [Nannocystis pusilla]|uniref:RNA polymerase sigma factor n=1 Tax=Nannocystis pusilla TaxID=889268 RepID=UPI003BF126BA